MISQGSVPISGDGIPRGEEVYEYCFGVKGTYGDSGAPVWIQGTGTAVGIVSSGANVAGQYETCFTPLLPEANVPGVPAALEHPGLAPLTLATEP